MVQISLDTAPRIIYLKKNRYSISFSNWKLMVFHPWYYEQITKMIMHTEHFCLLMLQCDKEAPRRHRVGLSQREWVCE